MSIVFYKVLHLIAIFFLLMSFGTLAALGGKEGGTLRRLATIGHGVALGVMLLAGFGLLAKLGLFGTIPLWAWAKVGVWVALGAAVAPLKRKPEWAPALWVIIPLFCGIAAWLAVAKPF